MDATIIEKRDYLISLLRNLDPALGAQIYGVGIIDTVQLLYQLAPEAIVRLFDPRLPEDIRRSAAELVIAILLDTSYLERYGLLFTLSQVPATIYLPGIIEAMLSLEQPEGVRSLGQVARRQMLYDCHTYACVLINAGYALNLLMNLTGYRQ